MSHLCQIMSSGQSSSGMISTSFYQILLRSKCNFKNVPMIGLVVIPTSRDEVQYCGWKSQENSLYSPQHCPSMASFPPMEVRQWAGNLLACRQASKWPRRAKVWIFESIITSPAVKYVKKKNGIKMALWIFNLSWMNVFSHSSLLALSYTHWLSTNTKKIKGR